MCSVWIIIYAQILQQGTQSRGSFITESGASREQAMEKQEIR